MPPTSRPSGVERSFGSDEVIVTKTDLQGRITYANDVFCRISAYPESELIGRPHNLIRHPEMPRGIFRLLWQTIAQECEIFAYVVNLAGDGASYWVLAHVTPSLGPSGRVVGYHSHRRLPDPQAIDVVRPLYQRMLTEERRHPNATDAAQAGVRVLEDHLAGVGLTYDEFVWGLTTAGAAA